jgi:hypothetical protein
MKLQSPCGLLISRITSNQFRRNSLASIRAKARGDLDEARRLALDAGGWHNPEDEESTVPDPKAKTTDSIRRISSQLSYSVF